MMAISDLLNDLEKAVAHAKAKEAAKHDADAKAAFAANEYNDAVSKVQTLQAKAQATISELFPSSRVRQS
jgi:hypothetical protein